MFILAPRYRLDDELPWLEGIDPSRHYWIAVNGDANFQVAIPGLSVSCISEFKEIIRMWRSLQAGEQIVIEQIASSCTIHCISDNCYAIEMNLADAPVWHLFDRETLESLLMTGHPDWQCASKDVELARRMLARLWQQPAVVRV